MVPQLFGIWQLFDVWSTSDKTIQYPFHAILMSVFWSFQGHFTYLWSLLITIQSHFNWITSTQMLQWPSSRMLPIGYVVQLRYCMDSYVTLTFGFVWWPTILFVSEPSAPLHSFAASCPFIMACPTLCHCASLLIHEHLCHLERLTWLLYSQNGNLWYNCCKITRLDTLFFIALQEKLFVEFFA